MSKSDNTPRVSIETETAEGREVSLSLENMTKVYDDGEGGVVAVNDFDLDIYDGEFIVLVGPSGCGKTTTLRTVAGLEQPTEGKIIIDGKDVSGQEPRERDVAMVFQNYALYPHKTVRGNIGFPLEIRKYPQDEIDEKVVETAEMLGIGELLDRRPSDLSGGQQQRVALGRAIIRDPELFLFDEPLSNLDAKLRIEMRTELNKLHDRVGKTSLYVTHDQAEAMTLSDRVVVMNDGEIQQVAPPQRLYDAPATRFVAEFIGSPGMNTVEGMLERRGDSVHVTWGENSVPLPSPVPDSVTSHAGDRVVLGLRPEDLSQEMNGPLSMDVTVTEPLGDSLLTRGTVGDTEMEVSLPPRSAVEVGDVLSLTADPERLHLFDPEAGGAFYHSAENVASEPTDQPAHEAQWNTT